MFKWWLSAFAALVAGIGSAALAQTTLTPTELEAYKVAAAETGRTGDPSRILQMARNWCQRGVPGTCQYLAPLQQAMAEYAAKHPGTTSTSPRANTPTQGTSGYRGPGSATTAAPAYRPSAPASPTSQASSTSSGGGPSKSYKNPVTGEDCVKNNGWRQESDNIKALYFSNSCDVQFRIVLTSPGSLSRIRTIDPREKNMSFYFTRSQYSSSSNRDWNAQWSWRVE